MLETLLKQDEEELQYLSSVLYASSIAQTEAEFDAIRGELKSAGYLKNFKEKDFRRKIKKQLPLEYAVSGGLRVISGRNNLQNEAVTFKTAEKHDLWFRKEHSWKPHRAAVRESARRGERSRANDRSRKQLRAGRAGRAVIIRKLKNV